jgi:hypothetical protein
MQQDAKSEGPLSRRDFLAGAGLGTGFGYSLIVQAGAFAAEDADVAAVPVRDAEEIRVAMASLAPASSLEARLAGEPHLRLVDLECDLLVAGGGMAGVCAALAAARNGARVVLVQDRSRLGGNASSEVRMHIVGADHHGGRRGWREGGLIEELRLENAVRNPHSKWEMWDLLLYDKVVSEPNIRLLLDAVVCGAAVVDGRITQTLVRCDKTEHFYRVTAPLHADCTGDCRLGLEAGAQFRTGHEGREAFGESLAPEAGGPGTLGSSILFTAKDQWEPTPFVAPAWARKITKEHLKHRRIGSWEYGYWWIEWGGQHSATHDNERIRFELLSIVLGVWDYIKNSGEFPESASWAMDWIGMIPGKRSSRRLDGPHILTQQDCLGETTPFADAVAIGGWPFDNHPPSGFDDPEVPPFTSISIQDVYSIPLRSLYSANVSNLFMAGRNISASHVAFSSTRVMATCSVVGQAAGAAAAYCAKHGLLPGDLTADTKHLDAFRQSLLRDDQTIKGLANNDPADLARSATVTASGVVEGSATENLINGWVRDMPTSRANRWCAPMSEEGAWVVLSWRKAQRIGLVQITFDTGFQRELTLSESSGVKKRVHFGPQPETVRDYTLEYQARRGGAWKPLATVTGNYQRLRRHAFPAVRARAIRLVVHATNGHEEARVYEVRCYAEA